MTVLGRPTEFYMMKILIFIVLILLGTVAQVGASLTVPFEVEPNPHLQHQDELVGQLVLKL